MGQVLRRSAVRALVCAAQSRLLPSFLPPCFCHQPPLHLWLFIMTQVNLIAISLAAALNSLFRSLAFFFVRAAAISCKPTATPTPQHAYSPHEEASLSLFPQHVPHSLARPSRACQCQECAFMSANTGNLTKMLQMLADWLPPSPHSPLLPPWLLHSCLPHSIPRWQLINCMQIFWSLANI